MSSSGEFRTYKQPLRQRLVVPALLAAVTAISILLEPSINFTDLSAEFLIFVLVVALFLYLTRSSMPTYLLYKEKIVQEDPLSGRYELMKSEIAGYQVVSHKWKSIELFKRGSTVRSMAIPRSYVDRHFLEWLTALEKLN